MWKVYFDGNFWGHRKGQRRGRELPLEKEFTWAGRHWRIPAAYVCAGGLVIDICMGAERREMEDFMERWKLSPEAERDFTEEEEMKLELENPLVFDFTATVRWGKRELPISRSCSVTWLPWLAEFEGQEAEEAALHYGLSPSMGWTIRRMCFPWTTKRPPRPGRLSLRLEPQPVSVPGPHFRVTRPGETFAFTVPADGTVHRLTVLQIQEEQLEESALEFPEGNSGESFRKNPLEFFRGGQRGPAVFYPRCFSVLHYAIEPELSEDAVRVMDRVPGDPPRRKESGAEGETSFSACATGACAVAIIGGADGPTSIFVAGSPRDASGKTRVAASSLHFEPGTEPDWQLIFYERREEMTEVELLETAK